MSRRLGFVWGKLTSGAHLRPERIPIDVSIHQIALGTNHYSVLGSGGELFVCGKNKYGQLGVGGGATESKSPVRVEGIPPVSHVDCGGAHTAAVTASGEVYTWGLGGQWWSWTLGGLGHGDRNSQAMPKQVAALEGIRVVKVACGKMHTLALTSEGSVYAWGEGQYGRLGLSSNSSRAVPTMIYQEVFGNEKVVDVQSGAYHGIALTESGKVYVWGRNHYGQIGSNSNNIDYFAVETTPFIPDNLNDLVIKSISASDQLSVAVTDDGRVYLWGGSEFMVPTDISDRFDGKAITQVAAGDNFCLAIDQQGNAYSWGKGGSACLGHGDKSTRNNPTEISAFSGSKVLQVFAGPSSAGAITSSS